VAAYAVMLATTTAARLARVWTLSPTTEPMIIAIAAERIVDIWITNLTAVGPLAVPLATTTAMNTTNVRKPAIRIMEYIQTAIVTDLTVAI
jgi:hypothetical protein